MLQTNIQKGAIPRPQLASHGRAGWGSAHDQVKDYFWSFSLNLFNLTFFYQKRDQWDCVQLQTPPHDSLSRQHVHNNVAHPVVPAPGILYTETEKCVFYRCIFQSNKMFPFLVAIASLLCTQKCPSLFLKLKLRTDELFACRFNHQYQLASPTLFLT